MIPESPLLSSSQIIKLKNEKDSDTLTDHVNQGRDKDNDELIHEKGNDVEIVLRVRAWIFREVPPSDGVGVVRCNRVHLICG